jgi:hypothetical protein
MRFFLLLLITLAMPSAFAQDIRDKVAVPATKTKISETIDPDSNIYGIPYGISEDEFIAQFGSPTGYLRLSAGESGMIYGRTHCFLFSNGRLSGVRISSDIIDWKIGNSLFSGTLFDQIRWRLENGITRDMNLAEVKRILGDRLMTQDYRKYYVTQKARIELDFSRLVSEGDKDEAHRVFGLSIKLR